MQATTAQGVLLVDDDPGVAYLQTRALERAGFRVVTAETIEEAFVHLAEQTFDLIVLDYCLSGEQTGLDFFAELRRAGYDVPVILVTGNSAETTVIQALRAGIRDYVTKSADYLEYLPHAVRRVTGQVELESKLAESEARFQLFMEHSPCLAYIKNEQGEVLFANRQCEIALNTRDWYGKTNVQLFPGDEGQRLRTKDQEVLATGTPMEVVEEVTLPNGAKRSYLSYKFPISDDCGNRLLGGMSIDITDRRHAEEQLRQRDEQLRQSQKLEALGTLSGGVAHEFNNLLQAITGYTRFALEGLAANDQRYQDLQQVLAASQRATALTRELLSFGRRNVLESRSLDSNELVAGLLNMLKPLLGASIEIVPQLASDPIIVDGDAAQLQQLLMNLCINARDAMPSGGQLVIRTEPVFLTELYCQHHTNAKPGHYLLLTVADNGCGIPADVKQRVFEPFFTTKEVGKGTGLGLAMVYGVVQQHQGNIELYSEVGKGTTFKIYLPAISGAKESLPQPALPRCRGGFETILIAEDEPLVRELIARILGEAGYQTLLACDGEDALALFLAHSQEISLALLDVVMPKKGGREVYYRMQQAKPDIRAIFYSGFDPRTAQLDIGIEGVARMLQKPVDPQILLTTVREVLDEEVACLKA